MTHAQLGDKVDVGHAFHEFEQVGIVHGLPEAQLFFIAQVPGRQEVCDVFLQFRFVVFLVEVFDQNDFNIERNACIGRKEGVISTVNFITSFASYSHRKKGSCLS